MWHIVTHHGELIETTENLRDVNRLDPLGVIYGHYLKDKLKEFSNNTPKHKTIPMSWNDRETLSLPPKEDRKLLGPVPVKGLGLPDGNDNDPIKHNVS